MTDARHSHGMILRHRVRNVGDWITVAEIMNQNVPAPSRQKIVTTPHSSKAQTSISGKAVEYSNLTLSMNYLPSTEASQLAIESGIDADDGNGRIDGWQIETPDGEYWEFKGWVMRYEVATPEDGHITAAVEIVVTGLVEHDLRGVVTLTSLAPVEGTELTASLNDPDGSSSASWKWQRKTGRKAWADVLDATGDDYTPRRGRVDSIEISNEGSGYNPNSPPSVTFANVSGANKVRATGVAVIEGGKLVRIRLTNPGRGYASAPAITIGSGSAAATAKIGTDVGSRLRAIVEYTDSLNSEEVDATSPATAPVATS